MTLRRRTGKRHAGSGHLRVTPFDLGHLLVTAEGILGMVPHECDVGVESAPPSDAGPVKTREVLENDVPAE